ncbi:hypothetical protein TNCV_650741 [Trichonephila clavipes]|nr:hypothetical protein TNCV_650741 [Trichonephila clavipes]
MPSVLSVVRRSPQNISAVHRSIAIDVMLTPALVATSGPDATPEIRRVSGVVLVNSKLRDPSLIAKSDYACQQLCKFTFVYFSCCRVFSIRGYI